MNIELKKANSNDVGIIHKMQVESFLPLLKKYQDYDTSPANENVERIQQRMDQPFTDYYLILLDNSIVGAIRIVCQEHNSCRISPIFILPSYWGRRIAQRVINMVEKLYVNATSWELDTILQEQGHCYLYEKMGYKKTGETKIINENLTIVFYKK